MAEAPIDSSMSDYAESSAAAMYTRDDDPMTRRLRSEALLNIDELIHLNQHTSSSPTEASTTGTRTTTIFSSHKPSTGTKPTSAGTSYPVPAGKGKAVATYASSVSATHGSGSDTELEANREMDLVGLGYWTVDGAPRTLKGSAKPRRYPRPIRKPKHKKPHVVVHQRDGAPSASRDDNVPAVNEVPRRNGEVTKYLRQRRNKQEHDQLYLAEEGRVSILSLPSSPQPKLPLSRARFYVLIALVTTIILTFSLFAFAAHHTGKGRMNCTKGIIFAGTVLVSCFTILTMVVARRALHEALLAGLLEFLIGFALVIEIHDFM